MLFTSKVQHRRGRYIGFSSDQQGDTIVHNCIEFSLARSLQWFCEMRDNPSRKASRREISQVSHNAARQDISRDFSREISCETSISSTVPNLHTCILTLKYVQTYLPTCKVPYSVSTGLAIQGLRDDTMESREKSGRYSSRKVSQQDWPLQLYTMIHYDTLWYTMIHYCTLLYTVTILIVGGKLVFGWCGSSWTSSLNQERRNWQESFLFLV